MPIEGFDFQAFAASMAEQAKELVPKDLEDREKEYIVKTLGNFTLLAGEALYNDEQLNLTAEQAVFITQVIAEWSFHKSVDVIRSGIPQQYWDGIMQKIAYTIFEISKQAFPQGLPHEKILELIELHVKKSYTEAITELRDKGVIDEGLMEFAASQSNMDRMAQEMQQQQQNPEGNIPQNPNVPASSGAGMPVAAGDTATFPTVDSKILKLATVAMIFKRMNQDKVQTILNRFENDDAETVIKFMRMPDLTEKIGAQNAMRCLQEIKSNLPKATDLTPNRVVVNLKKIASQYTNTQIDTILIKERIGVKRLVFNALEDKYYDKIPPKVASVVARHLRDSV